MKKSVVLLALAVFAGLAAGVCRAFELAFAFDADSRLLIFWHPSTVLLLILSAVFLAAAAWLAAASPRYRPGKTRRPPRVWLFCEAAAGALLLFSCAYGLFALRDNFHAVPLVFNLLGVMTALSIVTAAFYTYKGILTPSTGFYFTVPVYWCCFMLVLDFWSHSANPVIFSFVYAMFGLIFTTLSAHAAAGFFFGKPHMRRTLAYCAIGVFFILMTLVSLLLYPGLATSETFLKAAQADPGVLARYGFIILHLCALFVAAEGGAFTQPREEAPPAGDRADEALGLDIELLLETEDGPAALDGGDTEDTEDREE